MHHGGIDGDHQVQILQQPGGVREIRQFCAGVVNGVREVCELFRAVALLQAHQ